MHGRSLALLLVSVWSTASTASTDPEPSAQPPHAAFSVETGFSIIEPSFHAGLEALVPLGPVRLLVHADWNPWLSLQQIQKINRGVCNVGAGAEFLHFGGRVFTQVQAGASILLFRSAFDQPGTLGPFLAVSPAGFRFHVLNRHHLRLTPLSFHLLAPSLGSIPLITFQYRTTLAFEYGI